MESREVCTYAPENYPQERLLFSGLTATSKTTYSMLVAKSLGRPYFNAASELWQLAGIPGIPGNDLWVSPAAQVLQDARQGDQLDRELDQLLIQKTHETPDAVVDAWAIPWLWEGEAVRIFVQADLDTRVKRCMESSSSDVDITAAKAEKVITEKDNYTRELFQRLYDFDLFSDHDNFDIILDTSGFIENTPQKKGVQIATERFLPIAMRAILSASSKPQDSNAPTTPSSLPQVINLNPALVT